MLTNQEKQRLEKKVKTWKKFKRFTWPIVATSVASIVVAGSLLTEYQGDIEGSEVVISYNEAKETREQLGQRVEAHETLPLPDSSFPYSNEEVDAFVQMDEQYLEEHKERASLLENAYLSVEEDIVEKEQIPEVRRYNQVTERNEDIINKSFYSVLASLGLGFVSWFIAKDRIYTHQFILEFPKRLSNFRKG